MSKTNVAPASSARAESQRTVPERRAARPIPPRPSVGAPAPGSGGIRASRVLLVLFVALLFAISVIGLPYYVLPVAERVRSPLHPWLKPAGYIGQSAGLLAVAIFIFLWLYPIRKKARWLAWTGSVARWLDVHVLAALALPLLVAIHSAWRFEGLIGLGFWSMMVVWLSGIVGRYIYARIPRGKAGIELTLEEIATRRQQLLEQIATTHRPRRARDRARARHRSGRRAGAPESWGRCCAWWRTTWRAAGRRAGSGACARQSGPRRRKQDRQVLTWVLRLAKREMALTQQTRMLDATHAVFRWWHVLHRPVAIAALLAVLVHVTVVVALGATWLW